MDIQKLKAKRKLLHFAGSKKQDDFVVHQSEKSSKNLLYKCFLILTAVNKKLVFSRILPIYFVRVSLFLVFLFDVYQFSVQLLTAQKIYQGFSQTKDLNHKCFQSKKLLKT